MTMTVDDGGFQVQQSRSKTSRKRIYIGNLPQTNDIKSKLVDFIHEQAQLSISSKDVTVVRQGAAALVVCPDVNRAISQLNHVEFEGNALVVQREKKKRPSNNNAKKQPTFGGGWNQPTLSFNEPQEELGTERNKIKPILSETKDNMVFSDELELSQHIGSIVASELKAAEEDPSNGDVVNTMIASTAAMTLLSSTNAFGIDQNNHDLDQTVAPANLMPTAVGDPTDDNDFDFMSQTKKPLAELLADYGEQDLDFQKVIPTISTEEEQSPIKNKSSRREDFNNRLTLQGKAPIHVEVTSFGFIHGVPSDVRSGGWSYSHPLSPLDCRDLPQVPHYMARQDGLSPAVKRVLKNHARDSNDDTKRDYRVQEYANELGQQMFNSLYEAITDGGYGHASPLRMTVYIGSESGRHRSVVVCELAATALRKLLRSNQENRISQPVSVGTRHRDIERRQQQRDAERARPKQLQSKQKEFESEW